MAQMDPGITREAAYELLHQYNHDDFHIEHAQTVEGLMRYFAQQEDPENVEFWGLVGLLHDLDWEMFDPELHTIKTAELLEEAGVHSGIAHAIQTHQSDRNDELPKPEHVMEKRLYASDELSGLVCAAIKVRPSHSVMDMDRKSLKKKYKAKNFAAGCSREDIADAAELNGWTLDELFDQILAGMKSFADDRDIYTEE